MSQPVINKRSWTDEQLEAAVLNARSWRGVLRNLGLYAAGPNHVVKRQAQRLGLDTSHFGSPLRCDDAELREALAKAASWTQLLSALGLRPQSRRCREAVKARAERLGLSTQHLAYTHRRRRDPLAAEARLVPDLRHLREAAQSIAIAWFLLRSLWPAVPAETRHYDLLLETPACVKRVQVKTTTSMDCWNSWRVRISRHAGGGNKHGQMVPYGADEVDLFLIIDGTMTVHLIPQAAVTGRLGISLTSYRDFVVGSAASMSQPASTVAARSIEPLFRPPAEQPASKKQKASQPHLGDATQATTLSEPRTESLNGSHLATSGAPGTRPRREEVVGAAARWTEAELRAIAETSTSWADVLRAFGFKPSSTKPRRALQAEFQRFAIDTRHFVGQRRWADEALMRAAPTAGTWEQLCHALGISNARDYHSIRSAARRLGVNLDHLTLGPKAGPDATGLDLPERLAPDRLTSAAPSIAAGWFLLCGLAVSTPNEPELYDLVVHMPQGLKRVQVKATTSRDSRGCWTVRIGHRPDGSSSNADFLAYEADEVDLFFIVDGDLLLYLIPRAEIQGQKQLRLRRYRDYVVGDASSLLACGSPA